MSGPEKAKPHWSTSFLRPWHDSSAAGLAEGLLVDLLEPETDRFCLGSVHHIRRGHDIFFVPSYSRITILPESEATTCTMHQLTDETQEGIKHAGQAM